MERCTIEYIDDRSPYDIYSLFFSDELLYQIKHQTSRLAMQNFARLANMIVLGNLLLWED